jgi:hypothetical protein
MANAAERAKSRPDTELELLFPQHAWRAPVSVRITGPFELRRFCCAFCLYRSGLVGPQAAPLLGSAGEVMAHLAEHHSFPLGS